MRRNEGTCLVLKVEGGSDSVLPPVPHPMFNLVSRSSTYIYYYIIVHIFSMNNSTSHSNKYLLESHLLYIHCITTHHYTCSQRSCSGALVHIRANITTLYGLCSGAIIQHRHSIYTYISQRSCSGALVHIQVI